MAYLTEGVYYGTLYEQTNVNLEAWKMCRVAWCVFRFLSTQHGTRNTGTTYDYRLHHRL